MAPLPSKPELLGECSIQYSRSSGPGGQNVNKVNSKAQIFWPVYETRLFTQTEQHRIATKLANRINDDQEIYISSSRHRDQTRNLEDCVEKLFELVVAAVTPAKKRKKTRPSLASKRKRLDSKRKNSEKKRLRKVD